MPLLLPVLKISFSLLFPRFPEVAVPYRRAIKLYAARFRAPRCIFCSDSHKLLLFVINLEKAVCLRRGNSAICSGGATDNPAQREHVPKRANEAQAEDYRYRIND